MPFDCEGVDKRQLDLVASGVARGIAHDLSSAARFGVAPTGHAQPPGLNAETGSDFGPTPLHLVMEPGDSSVAELIESTEYGVLVSRIHGFVSPLSSKSGYMAGTTRDGLFLIENGRITGPIRNFRWMDRIFSAFSTVEGISKERRIQFTDELWFPLFALVPTVKLGSFNFVDTQRWIGWQERSWLIAWSLCSERRIDALKSLWRPAHRGYTGPAESAHQPTLVSAQREQSKEEQIMKSPNLLFVILMVAISLTGCAAAPTPSTGRARSGTKATQPPPPAQAPKELVIVQGTEPQTMDMQMITAQAVVNIGQHIQESLITYDNNMKLQPQLAVSWKQIEPKVWQYKLREGVKFSNGEPFNAEQVKFSFDRVMDPKSTSMRKGETRWVAKVEVVDAIHRQYPHDGRSALVRSLSLQVSDRAERVCDRGGRR